MNEELIPPITEQTRFWKIAPGEGAFLWDEWREGNTIAIGWPGMGDATQVSRADFEKRSMEIVSHPDQCEAANRYSLGSVNQLWRFAREIKIGDRVLANQGTS